MIHHQVKQGSDEWHDLRCGIPTASSFHRIITPGKWEPVKSETRRGYLIELVAERIFGLPIDRVNTAAMQHGKDWEPIARAAYESLHGVDIEECGIYTNDVGSVGASPDGIVGQVGLVEFKNPKNQEIHLENLFDSLTYAARAANPEWTKTALASEVTGFLREHWCQAQGQLYVTGFEWVDLVSNFAGLPMVVVRVYPNVLFQKILGDQIPLFVADLAKYEELARAQGWMPETQSAEEPLIDWLGVSDADVDALLESGV